MSNSDFQTALQRAMRDEHLLGERQQRRAALSPSLAFGRHFGPPLPTARQAAVMALIEVDPLLPWQKWTIPLTVRPEYLQSHPGQISLPGGSLEPGESPQVAAEREFQEELGLPAFPGKVLGSLQSLYVFNSDYQVVPFVACSQQLGSLTPCANEVARLIHLPLETLLTKAHGRQRARFVRDGVEWTAPVIQMGLDQIWGATAMILGELAAVVEAVTQS